MEKITAKLDGACGLSAIITAGSQRMTATLEKGAMAKLEEREVIPSGEEQIITPSAGYGGMSKVKVAAIPQNYGLITYDGTRIVVS